MSKRYYKPLLRIEENDNSNPILVFEGYDPGREKKVFLSYLTRQDLMSVAGTIAKSKGESSGGVKSTNDQLKAYIKKNTGWSAAKPQPKPAKAKPAKPDADESGRIPTQVTCDCGHEYTYRINSSRYEVTKKWLEDKPCPPCQKKGVQPGENKQPEPQPEPETPDTPEETPVPDVDVDLSKLDLDKLADILTQKVQERLKPFALPELHHVVVPEVIKSVQADVPVWLQGPPGTSKSTIGAQVANTLGLAFHAISCHEAMTRSDMFGYTDAHGTDHRSPLWEAYENGGLLLLDEIDNGNANILAALNSALSNGHCTFAGHTIQKHPDFRVVATANTAGLGPESGFIGRMGVDLATLDRFVTIMVPIDEALERGIVESILPDNNKTLLRAVRKLRKLADQRGLRIVVSPRTSINSARLMKHGTSLRDALIRTGLKGLDDVTLNSLLTEAGL